MSNAHGKRRQYSNDSYSSKNVCTHRILKTQTNDENEKQGGILIYTMKINQHK